jgi:hypothetical protein
MIRQLYRRHKAGQCKTRRRGLLAMAGHRGAQFNSLGKRARWWNHHPSTPVIRRMKPPMRHDKKGNAIGT